MLEKQYIEPERCPYYEECELPVSRLCFRHFLECERFKIYKEIENEKERIK